MADPSRSTRRILTTALTFLIGFLILQALGYGIGFTFDPVSGAGEFASPSATPVDDLTVALVRLVGIGMLGSAVLLVLSAVLIWRANPAGTYIAVTIGGVYIATGVAACLAGWGWDAYFYGGTGAVLLLLAIAERRLRSV